MIHEFDILVLDGGNLVISDDLNILKNTLQISSSVIVLNKEDIDHIFAPKITKSVLKLKKESLISRTFF